MERRKFLEMFVTLSVGVPVAQKLGFMEELYKWVLSPKKTIFVPPPQKVEIANLKPMWDEIVTLNNYAASGYIVQLVPSEEIVMDQVPRLSFTRTWVANTDRDRLREIMDAGNLLITQK